MDISIVIVNWNTEALLRQCLDSLYQNLSCAMEIFVVDNKSSDASVPTVQSRFPAVHLLENTQNVGFARATNQALRKCAGAYLLLLNPDTIVCPDAIQHMMAFLQNHPEAGAVGPQLLNPDHSTQQRGYYRRFPSLTQALLFYTLLRKWTLKIGPLRERYWEHTDMSKTCEVDQIPGACLLFRRAVLDNVGPLDENLFLFFEDVDFCYRMKEKGWKLFYNAQSQVVHQGGASLDAAPRCLILVQFYKSMHYFFQKHGGPWKALVLKAMMRTNHALSLVLLWMAMILQQRNRQRRKEYATALLQLLKAR